MEKKIGAFAVFTIAFSFGSFANDGKINFTGAITDTACTIVNNDINPLTVDLGTVSKDSFNNSSSSSPTLFTISLDDCPAGNASLKFEGIPATPDNTVIALTTGTGVASGVGVQISDTSGNIIPLYTASPKYTLTTGSNNLDFIARYKAFETVVSGVADSTASFTVVYN